MIMKKFDKFEEDEPWIITDNNKLKRNRNVILFLLYL